MNHVRMHMMRFPAGVLCERARTWAALAPDGELSELERHLLDKRLVRCAACSRFSAEVGAIALELPQITDFSDNVQREDAQFRALRHAGITESTHSTKHLAI